MGEKKTKLMLYSTLVEVEVEVGVELDKNMNEKEQENLKIKNENCHVTNGPLSPVHSMVDSNG